MRKLRDPDTWSLAEAAPADRKEYMKVLGSLMFAAMTCRPDLAFSVSFLSQWGSNPQQLHFDALTRVLRYLVHTKKAVLVYHGATTSATPTLRDSDQLVTPPQPVIFTDSDWGSEEDALSRAGWTTKLAGGAIIWNSKKLNMVALSSTEAEYKALLEEAKDAVWLRQIMGELHLPIDTVKIFCDNQSAKAISKNPIQHFRTRHFRLAWHYVRDLQANGEVEVQFVRTAMQDADVLTKALPVTPHYSAMGRLGLHIPT